jgi:hypothetical protein
MPGLSYPFVFECDSCGVEVEVTRDQATYMYPDPDNVDAVDVVLEQVHGWTKDYRGAWCSDCEAPTEE